MSVSAVIQSLLLNPQVGWSVGRPGAIAEFYRDEDEPFVCDALSIATSRGALRIVADDPDARLFAGESLSHAEGGSWTHWLALCLPKGRGTMRGATAITEIGADRDSIQATGWQQSLLFDLGIGGPYFQLCIRTECASLIAELRSAAGRALLGADALLRSLIASSPTRVFESRLARIEVIQPIAPAWGKSPEGPHTHLLPSLIHGDGADSTNAPAGWVAQIVAYPPNPLRDANGRSKPFDREQYQAFQHWVREFGDPGHALVKRTVMDNVRAGARPSALGVDPPLRESVRIALRQLRCLDGDSAALALWRAAYDG